MMGTIRKNMGKLPPRLSAPLSTQSIYFLISIAACGNMVVSSSLHAITVSTRQHGHAPLFPNNPLKSTLTSSSSVLFTSSLVAIDRLRGGETLNSDNFDDTAIDGSSANENSNNVETENKQKKVAFVDKRATPSNRVEEADNVPSDNFSPEDKAQISGSIQPDEEVPPSSSEETRGIGSEFGALDEILLSPQSHKISSMLQQFKTSSLKFKRGFNGMSQLPRPRLRAAKIRMIAASADIQAASLDLLKRTKNQLHLENINLRQLLAADDFHPLSRAKDSFIWIAVFLGEQISQPEQNRPLTSVAIFLCILLGSSLGFHSYLYFISVGFGAAIALPTAVGLLAYNSISKFQIPLWTNVHTALTLVWALRLMLFLLHREYINWPQYHLKVVQTDKRSKLESKFSAWVTCAMFYFSLVMPCFYRMQAAADNKTPQSQWGAVGVSGVIMQILGLAFESVADAQKAAFKVKEGNRNKWCHEGLWSLCTHPNYLGESVFWIGTYLGGIASQDRISQKFFTFCGLFGILTVMKGAVDSLGSKQMHNYQDNAKFLDFRKRRGFFGPLRLKHKAEVNVKMS